MTQKNTDNQKTGRLVLLDTIRGFTLLSMTLYHGVWDLVYLRGMRLAWYRGQGAFLWQQSICWTFILLSGFCIPFSRRRILRGAQVFGGGLLVTAATLIFLPQDRVVFGVLTFLGSAMLLMAALEKPLFSKIPPAAGLCGSFLLFALTYGVNGGGVGIFAKKLIALPASLYNGYFMTYLGFMDPWFYSTDYFSLLPWFFLFLAGYFLSRLLAGKGALRAPVFCREVPALSFLGRHSLPYYLLHQAVLYLLLVLLPSMLL